MKFFALIVAALVVVTGVLTVRASTTQRAEQQARLQQQIGRERAMLGGEIDIQARFLIYTNGTKRILFAKKYLMQWQDAFLRTDNPSIIHVRARGVRWDDFFYSIPIDINQTCLYISDKQQFCSKGANELKFYLNGEKAPNLLSREIHDGDRALFTYGSENSIELQHQLNELEKLP